jgi:hypothetical protein
MKPQTSNKYYPVSGQVKRMDSSWADGQIRLTGRGLLASPGRRILRGVFEGGNKEIRHRDDALFGVQTPVL